MHRKSKNEHRVFIALGSNLGDRKAYIISSMKEMSNFGISVVAVSSLYETKPWGDISQNSFLNAVVEIETKLPPFELLTSLKEIEKKLKKKRIRKWGPRTIDLDIIYYGEKIIIEKDLIIPHPNMYLRNFVLVPLTEIAPDFVHPVLKRKTKLLLEECQDTGEVLQLAFQCRL